MMRYSAAKKGFFLPKMGSIPADAVEISEVAYQALIAGQEAGQQIVADAQGYPQLANPATPQPTLNDARRERDRRIAAGCTVAITGITNAIPITGRPADRDNLSGLAIVALARQGASDTTPIRFRDAENTTHMLTPSQMMEILTGGAEFIEACHEVVWSWSDAGSVPADYADDAHWP